ncbi:MAG: hypothetical protein Q7R76_02090 [Candidatus Woesearchaeota archaeon]|nr:hypothetical protein [Candidatus Woesearchaeota archaeon]
MMKMKNKLNNRFNKRGQAEIMGIALVVILITIGIVYLAKYSAEPPKKTQEEFQRRELPKTIITSIVEVVSTCNDEKMADVIQDCGFARSMTCTDATQTVMSSCDYLKTTLKGILDNMLGRFQHQYQLRLLRGEPGTQEDLLEGAVKSEQFNDACPTFETAAQPLLFDLTLELKVCY